MNDRDLVRMANQITAFFEPYPKGEAIDGIAKHLHLFWDPRMRNQLKAFIDNGGEGLVAAVPGSRGRLLQRAQVPGREGEHRQRQGAQQRRRTLVHPRHLEFFRFT